MKKLFLCLLFSVGYFLAEAQLFYLQAGVNLANISTTNDGKTEKNNTLTTFNAGFMGRFGLSDAIDFESGLLVMGQGSKAETYFSGQDYVKSKFNPIYIQLPLNVVIKVPLQKTTSLFFNAGPYVAVGIAGKSRTESSIGLFKSTMEESIHFSNDDPFTSQQDDAGYNKLKRFDYGVNAGGGLDLGKVILKANYGLGLAKINSTQPDNGVNDKNKYRTVSLSVGIPLGR
ncbi:MAG: porin family protein [Ferruginibacter sp.]